MAAKGARCYSFLMKNLWTCSLFGFSAVNPPRRFLIWFAAVVAVFGGIAAATASAAPVSRGYLFVAGTDQRVREFAVRADGSLNGMGGIGVSLGKRGTFTTSPDGTYLYTLMCCSYRFFQGYGISSGGSVEKQADNGGYVGKNPDGIVVAPNGREVYVLNYSDETISAFKIARDDSSSGVPGSPFSVPLTPTSAVVTSDSSFLYVMSAAFNKIAGFEVNAQGSLAKVPGSPYHVDSPVFAAVTAPDGRHLFAVDGNNQVRAYHIGSDGSLGAVDGSPFGSRSEMRSFPPAVAISRDGSKLFISNPHAKTLTVYSIADNGELTETAGSPTPIGTKPVSLATTSDGKYLYSANPGDGSVSGYGIREDGSLHELPGSPFPIEGGAFKVSMVSPQGR